MLLKVCDELRQDVDILVDIDKILRAVAVAAPDHCSVDTESVDGNGGLQQHFRRARVRGTVYNKSATSSTF